MPQQSENEAIKSHREKASNNNQTHLSHELEY